MTFIWPKLLLALSLLPLLLWAYLRLIRRRGRAAEELGGLEMTDAGAGPRRTAARHAPPALMFFGLGLLLIGLARPQMTVELPRVQGTVILAFDVSNSMSAEDFEPNRLEAAKAAAKEFVEYQPPTVQLGVVAFGGTGLVLQPPTDDQAAILASIDRLSPQGGTSLGQGIFTSLNAIAGRALSIEEVTEEGTADALRLEEYSSAVVLLLTDGENTDVPDPLKIAQVAAEAGVRVYAIGVGSQEGAVIELEGFNILTQLDQERLEQIADVTNGEYFQAEDQEALAEIYENIDLQLTVRGEEMEVTSLAAAASLLLLLMGGGISLSWFGRVP